jgi:protein TonB
MSAIATSIDFADFDSRPSNTGLLVAVIVSAIAHHFFFAALARTRIEPPAAKKPVDIQIVETTRKPPPPLPPLPKPPEPRPAEVIKPKRVAVAQVHPSAPRAVPPETPRPQPKETPPPAAPAPMNIGLNLSSTAKGGGFAAPVGTSLDGQISTTVPTSRNGAGGAGDDHDGALPQGQHFVPSYQTAEPPSLIGDFKPPYPDSARKDGLEGQVTLKLFIDATGRVTRAQVLRGAGHGFDEAAVEGARHLRFKPARFGDEAVATEITYTMTFLLD